MAQQLTLLDRIFGQSLGVIMEPGEMVTLGTIEPGSLWLELLASSPEVLGVVGGLAAIAMRLSFRKQSQERSEEEMRVLGMQDEMLQSMVDNHKAIMERAAQRLVDERFPSATRTDSSNEATMRLLKAANDLSQQFRKGVKLRLVSAEEVDDRTKEDFDLLEQVEKVAEFAPLDALGLLGSGDDTEE